MKALKRGIINLTNREDTEEQDQKNLHGFVGIAERKSRIINLPGRSSTEVKTLVKTASQLNVADRSAEVSLRNQEERY